ncbi:selenocysteine-specific elongation factor [Actinoplanes campanulatus]|uniref:Selenocysteine-specific elongation factor n=1 Tax=Actinoplanes campanulatus TaxID=113559 RepID=A0A7W5AE52_9ACTN|nr:selenocysteine-specific translation elongation factor [Actinoplanes campanulatus]MBB3094533.1 selenocysteine-specific elongation factor [Actinoplanes campanulatus]GGN21739.1 selenocysteine-specific translation elongation factor [Actinoplanes campanulatus]GID35551.1 selenocysteine-specific translation elongation factor [Actinoplanes campanulatus]
MFVIATAGHVDHGKSTLVRALTGMEPDRWAEERRRGMTIDLGFAWTSLADDEMTAFVDVPGHQRFVTNMLAGVGPVTAVMFVVAADEGWRQQSAEHLAALHALDVRHGVLAVTRSDLADPGPAIAQARERLDGTGLAGIPAVAVSAVTGQGLAALRDTLRDLTRALPAPAPGPARLWVDRSFSVRGSGTVVTGTLASGTVTVGDDLLLYPSGRTVQVRGLQSLKTDVDRAGAVSRLAVNLRGLKTDEVRRGHALVQPGAFAPVTSMDVRLVRAADRLPAQLTLHLGSAAVAVRVRMLGPSAARLTPATPLPLHVGERGLLRDPGARHVVAGFVVLDTMPPGLHARGDARRRATALAGMRDRPTVAEEVGRRGAVRREALVMAGVLAPGDADPDGVVTAGGWLVDPVVWKQWTAALHRVVDEWAAANPLSPGIAPDAAARRAGITDARLVGALAAEAGLVLDVSGVHGRDTGIRFPAPIRRALDEICAGLRDAPFAAPGAEDLARLGLSRRHLAAAVTAGVLIRITDGVYLLPGAPAEALRRVAALPQPFTVSQARAAWDTSRRVAVPLLEHLDRQGATRRLDTARRILTKESR